ncbi:uncharacterized protein V1516DRAFT_697283 [Lipomyces oligophaga]|uniref:uncharacterized protein n=1 Tax=Lipomyces oligophaga TaxID=45792 RepID=UPI0034CDD827
MCEEALKAARANVARYEDNEAGRPEFDSSREFVMTRTVNPSWKPGDGASDDEWTKHKKVSINPADQPALEVYKLLISGIVPRPIGFLSTINPETGKGNLAPYSFFEVVASEPPTFIVSVAGSKDSLLHIRETKETVINVISEWFIDAANYTSITSPTEISEWELSGLTPQPSTIVKPACVAESAFNIECKLVDVLEVKSARAKDKINNHILVLEGVAIHVREDMYDPERNIIDLAKLKPIGRAGGISYVRILEGFELPRYEFDQQLEDEPALKKVVGNPKI